MAGDPKQGWALPAALTINQQFLAALVVANVLVMLGAGVLFYSGQKRALLSGIDQKLTAVAMLSRQQLPEDYHDRITDASSVSGEAFRAQVERNNRICEQLGLEYIWSLMETEGGRIVFTSATSPDKSAGAGHALFFEPHTNPERYTSTFETMRTTYASNRDKWGDIRMALVPFRDAKGRKYLFGASVNLAEVRRQLRLGVARSVLVGVGGFVLSMGLGLWVSRRVSQPLSKLAATVRAVAKGQEGLEADERGSYEQAVLARSFNQMNRALQGRISTMRASQSQLIDRYDCERRQIEGSLQMSEQRYRGLLDFAVDGILIGDPAGVITDANLRMLQLLGLEREAVLGKHIREMPFTEESMRRSPFRFDLLLLGETVISERTIRRVDGSEVDVEMHTKMMPDGSYQSIYHDITARKRAQYLLESWNAELERRVVERTVEVENYARQLKELTGRLIRAEEDERRRLSDILHEDLQQTLFAARITLTAVRQGARGTVMKEQLARVDEILQKSANVTRSLVQEIAVPAVREGTVATAVSWLAQQMRERFGLEVSLKVAEGVPRVSESVYLCLYRVVQELLFNVVKYAGVSAASVTVERTAEGAVRVTVADRGCGFSATHLRHVLKNGAGTGLFGIRQRLEGLGGSVRYVSAEGEGTTVLLTVPPAGCSDEVSSG